jgi:hypothetical protein
MVKTLVPRMQGRGFYASSTDNRGIEFSVYRGMYKRAMKLKRDSKSLRRDESWYEWLLANGYGGAPWNERLTAKPHLKIYGVIT